MVAGLAGLLLQSLCMSFVSLPPSLLPSSPPLESKGCVFVCVQRVRGDRIQFFPVCVCTHTRIIRQIKTLVWV